MARFYRNDQNSALRQVIHFAGVRGFGETHLGKGHARSGDACVLDGYCGDTEKLYNAIAQFAICYADQVAADYELFNGAVKEGTTSHDERRGVMCRLRSLPGKFSQT
jgi:Uncharacterized protein conserved in bacteria (DUF2252)